MLVNGVVFRHGHRLADGRIISHAHPFRSNGKGPILPNSHTSLELLLLDAVSNPVLDMPSFEMPEFGLVELFTIPERPVSYESLLLVRSLFFSFLRGPPAFS
ncbi:hypothetical protein SAMN04488090_4917 [Siphonobacter aquaeclarae]|uniref:Uncharacterized protein n=2 Tax=Siphonobacter aquaeclarae TaxID=563176 RepID=A0A1G9YD06_9BACT|nr:hypothetical protein SAMN04488090_4917 [Siphonobacter aquaeclarae]